MRCSRRSPGSPTFYGNLADEELGRKIVTPPKAKAPTAEEQKAARDNPGIRRAMAFFRLEHADRGGQGMELVAARHG